MARAKRILASWNKADHKTTALWWNPSFLENCRCWEVYQTYSPFSQSHSSCDRTERCCYGLLGVPVLLKTHFTQLYFLYTCMFVVHVYTHTPFCIILNIQKFAKWYAAINQRMCKWVTLWTMQLINEGVNKSCSEQFCGVGFAAGWRRPQVCSIAGQHLLLHSDSNASMVYFGKALKTVFFSSYISCLGNAGKSLVPLGVHLAIRASPKNVSPASNWLAWLGLIAPHNKLYAN